MQIGDKLISRSVINFLFEGEIVKHTKEGEIDAIMPTVSGQGWTIGTHQHTLDSTDPWPEGYRISYNWHIKL